MARALIFALTGIANFAFWFVTKPSTQMTASMTEWPNVLWFSGTLLALAVSLVVFGRMMGGRLVVRLAGMAAAGVSLASAANIVEDGFRVEGAFFAFIVGTLILDVALLALTVVVARTSAGQDRLLALVPAGTLVAILLFVVVGGPLMLVTWLGAAAAALILARQQASSQVDAAAA